MYNPDVKNVEYDEIETISEIEFKVLDKEKNIDGVNKKDQLKMSKYFFHKLIDNKTKFTNNFKKIVHDERRLRYWKIYRDKYQRNYLRNIMLMKKLDNEKLEKKIKTDLVSVKNGVISVEDFYVDNKQVKESIKVYFMRKVLEKLKIKSILDVKVLNKESLESLLDDKITVKEIYKRKIVKNEYNYFEFVSKFIFGKGGIKSKGIIKVKNYIKHVFESFSGGKIYTRRYSGERINGKQKTNI